MVGFQRLLARLVAASLIFFATGLAASTPALANDEPGTHPITLTRGGQVVATNALDVEVAPDGRLMRAGSLIVKFRSSAGAFDRDVVNRLAGALRAERMIQSDTVRVQVGRTLTALWAYLGHFAVERVEPDYIAEAIGTPNDPSFAQQWGMAKIGAPAAWDTSTGDGVRIAILDCGIYHPGSSTYTAPDGAVGHPDLRSGKVLSDKNFTTASTADDYCNHGTHVAGIAAANTNNGVGVAGLGYNAKLVNVKVLGDNGSGSFSWIQNGILYAAGCDTNPCGPRRAEIINMSLGATGSCTSSMQSAIDKAWAQGLVIVAAAGNNGASGAITPANCQHVVGVAASDQNDAKASFSNYGSAVDVAAPGVSILSSDYVGGYASFSGTSMASPHVAGLAALVWNRVGGSNASVVDRITCTANENALAGSANGRIDAAAAVTTASCGAPPPAPTLAIGDGSANEGNTGLTPFTFTVTRSGSTTDVSSVSWSTSDGSATAGSDYVAANGTLTFAAGVTSQTITVQVNGDTTAEPNETFTVNLSGASGATIGDAQGVGTIVNDDAAPLPTLSINDNSRVERDSGSRNLTFTITLSTSSSQSVSVAWATANGSAAGGSSCSTADYLTRSGSVTFSPGATSRNVSVPICGDRRIEGDETFSVNLTNPVNATIADGTGVGTILNDD